MAYLVCEGFLGEPVVNVFKYKPPFQSIPGLPNKMIHEHEMEQSVKLKIHDE